MNVFIVLTTVLAVTRALPLSEVEQHWKIFKLIHGKQYANKVEENIRKEIFAKHLLEFEEHNKLYESGLVSYQKGVNQFADMTREEFLKTLTPMNSTRIAQKGLPFVPPANVELPASVDWRKKGVVTPVKNQKGCGACYAFGGVGALEAHLAIKTGKLVRLSEQNIVDCSQKYHNSGCHHGWHTNVFTYARGNGGIDTEKSYPYEGKVGKCRYNLTNSGGTDSGYVAIKKGNESELQTAVATKGPIAVAFNAAPLFDYHNDVYEGPCDPYKLNHVGLIVGYGTTSVGKNYWIVKNSWGKHFGEDGYFLYARNKNQCGIALYPTYPIV